MALRFLKEDPWARLAAFREAMPNLLLQALLRSANGVGYANYPDNVVRYFVAQAAAGGVDVFRVFDCLNWVENMKVTIESVLSTDRLCEAAICYTGNLTNPRETKYSLEYYLKIGQRTESHGRHVLCIKDMAGLCQPRAAATLVKALKEELGLPIHFHTHDTSGIGAASVLAAIEAGADAVDGAIDALRASRPSRIWDRSWRRCAMVRAIGARSGQSEADLRVLGAGPPRLRRLRERYPRGRLGGVRTRHAGRAVHQFARAGALSRHRGASLVRSRRSLYTGERHVRRHREGDADLQGRRRHGHHDGHQRSHAGGGAGPKVDVAFPESVVQLFRGELGQPAGGFPADLQRKVLAGRKPLTVRAGELLPPADLEAERAAAEAKIGRTVTDFDLASHLMYPKVFADYAADRASFGEVSILPTSVFFYGMLTGQEINIDLERGKT